MLSSRQKWRHQSLVGIRRKEHDFLYSQGIDDISSRIFPKSASESSLNDSLIKPTLGGKKHATTGSLIDTKNIMLIRTKVRFNSAIRVVLIPTVAECRQHGLGELLWWDDNHYKEFKLAAITELKLYMLQHTGMTSKEAIKDLYQPSARDNDTPSPTKSEGSTTPSFGKSLPSRRNSGRISADLLTSMDGLLVKSKAKNIKFEKSIFKPGDATSAVSSGSANKDLPAAPASGAPLNPLGLIMG